MKIEYKKANLLDAPERVIVHGCNAQGVMNSGVAKAIRERYPQAFADYKHHEATEGLKLGDIAWSVNEPHIVANAITQQYYGREPGTRYVSYDAITDAVQKLDEFAAIADTKRIALPFLGAGLANGNWTVIAAIIEEYSLNFTPMIYYLPEFLPEGLPRDLRERLISDFDYTGLSLRDFTSEIDEIKADFPNHADWPINLPAGHWRAIKKHLA